MSLKSKALLLVTIGLAVVAAVGVAIGRFIVLPRFTVLENRAAMQAVRRCVETLQQEPHDLQTTCYDWARWDDTYRFAKDRNEAYIEGNLGLHTMQTLRLSLLCIYGPDGRGVWVAAVHPRTGRETALPDFPTRGLPTTHPLLANTGLDGRRGFWPTAWGPMAVTAAPITTSDRKAPPRGTMVMGRVITDALVSELGRRLSQQVCARSVDDRRWSARQRAAALRLGSEGACLLLDAGDGALEAYEVIHDLQGRPILLVQASMPKHITDQGRAAVRALSLSMLLALVCIAPLAAVLLLRGVVDPVVAVTRRAMEIAERGDPSERLALTRRDEIGALAAQFDAMLAKLAEARKRLLSRSYESGMQQMAATTLHNVRNALAPAVVGLAEARERLQAARPDVLEAAATELQRRECDAERHRDLERYVALAAGSVAQAVRDAEGDLDAVAQHVSRLEGMLPDGLELGRTEPLLEEFLLSTSVAEALALVPPDLRSALETRTHETVAEAGPVRAVRFTVDQVLASVLINAAEARNGASDQPVHVDFGASLEVANGRLMVHLRVNDDGAGMTPETLARIFENGFTTKVGGLGLGLHWCATAIQAMGGRMYAESPGAGQGSCIHVLLPAANGKRGEQREHAL